MATIKFLNGSEKTIDAEAAHVMWQVLNGDIEGTIEQQKFCEQIASMSLNWRNAPDSYLIKYAKGLVPIIKGGWMCDRQGNLTRPEYSDKDNWRVSRLLGLVV